MHGSRKTVSFHANPTDPARADAGAQSSREPDMCPSHYSESRRTSGDAVTLGTLVRPRWLQAWPAPIMQPSLVTLCNSGRGPPFISAHGTPSCRWASSALWPPHAAQGSPGQSLASSRRRPAAFWALMGVQSATEALPAICEGDFDISLCVNISVITLLKSLGKNKTEQSSETK